MPLTDRIKGTSDFAKQFAAQGPKDSRGRSLREFDLQTRLFKYPCSYLVYSDAFNRLPDKMKERLYGRLWEILSGKDTSADFQRMTPETKRAIREILAETKPDLPDFWNNSRTAHPSLDADKK